MLGSLLELYNNLRRHTYTLFLLNSMKINEQNFRVALIAKWQWDKIINYKTYIT